MSICFIVIPTVAAGWPFLASAAATAAAACGFRLAQEQKQTITASKAVELELENSEVLTERVRPDEELVFTKEDVTIKIYKDPRGRCAVHVSGDNKTDLELQEEGTRVLNKIKQHYAYQKVTQELKQRGFSITQEEVNEEGRIKIRLRKFE